jgi:hypothetical protein
VAAEPRIAGRHHDERLETATESVAKRTFQWAIDWPGWCRSGKTELEALDRFIAASERYNVVIERAGLEPVEVLAHDIYVVDSVEGGATTDFGAPERWTASDDRPTDTDAADRIARLVEASWSVLDDIVSTAPAELRKGPRGGGRDRDKVVEHVLLAEHAYARNMGLKLPAPDAADPASVAVVRDAIAAVLREPSDGSPIEGRKWNRRYAARRVAWHVLDHAWEIQDRTDPA